MIRHVRQRPVQPDESPTQLIIDIMEAFEPWMEAAVCASAPPEVWFPEGPGNGNQFQIRAAVRACLGCPVRELCLDYAMKTNQRFGVWGAKTARQRAHLKRTYTGPVEPYTPHSELLGTRKG